MLPKRRPLRVDFHSSEIDVGPQVLLRRAFKITNNLLSQDAANFPLSQVSDVAVAYLAPRPHRPF